MGDRCIQLSRLRFRFQCQGQADGEYCATAIFAIFPGKCSAMRFDKSARDREAHTGSFRLGRKEWLEKLIDNSRRKTRSAIAHAHADLALVRALGPDDNSSCIRAYD